MPRLLTLVALFVALLTSAWPAAAQSAGATGFPNRRVEIIVPFPPGGTADLFARTIGQKLSESWGQPVVVTNKAGGTGSIGAEAAAQAAPDGHTLLLTSYANRRVLFDPQPPVAQPGKDLVPLSLVAQAPLVLVAHPAFPARSFAEFLALVRDKPGQFNYASIGNGTPSHLAMETLRRMGSLDLRHVPYKGSGQALADVIAGHVPVMFDSVVSATEHVRGGRLRALAVSTATRLPSLPDVPTIAESGLAGFNVYTWAMVYAPPGLPADRAERIRGELGRILALPDVVARFRSLGAVVPDPMAQAQVAAFLDEDVRTWRQLIRERGITPD
jgi:tripartite-type tricarboxylate transporter receptor subunit TctC